MWPIITPRLPSPAALRHPACFRRRRWWRFDFSGEVWPNGPLAPDPNPLDLNGHGTHTSDILGGKSLDGLHLGTAPGAQLYAVTACCSVRSACSGVAIREGLDFALDPAPGGRGDHPDRVAGIPREGSLGQGEDGASEA